MSTQAIREYLHHLWRLYQAADRKLKSAILTELSRNLGVHRKSAVRLMNQHYPPRSLQGFRGGRPKRYSEESKELLQYIWKKCGYMAVVRLKSAIPEWLPYIEHRLLSESVRQELIAMSPSSMERFLKKAKADLRRRHNTGTRKGLKKYVAKVPIRNLSERPTELGHCEIDSVAHCGDSMSGIFVWSLTLTDIVCGWTECEAVWGKDAKAIRRALELIEARLPFPLRALYSDNGGEFLNEEIIDGFAKEKREDALPVFRGRPYRKNDQCYVEQKNFTHVRHLFGYGRIDWQKSVAQMNNVYRKEWRLLQNHFIPQQQLLSKLRIGSKVKRTMSIAETPYVRIIRQCSVQVAEKLNKERQSLNPVKLREAQLWKTRRIFGYYKNSFNRNEWGKWSK